jgi:type II secretory pathway pseudopilin PulG
LLFVVALIATVCGVAVPPAIHSVDAVRAAGAARYVSARLQRARMEAVLRSADVGVRFSNTPSGYTFVVYVDGNGNGVLSRDILRGVDWPLGSIERLPDTFAGVDFGALPGLPAVDPGGVPPGADPIRLGASSTATFTAHGTSSTGSVYIRGRNQRQFVVRIYGDTGKTRVLEFENGTGRWKPL